MFRLPRCEVLTQVLQKIKVVCDVTVSNNGPCNTCCNVNKLCFLPCSVFLCHIQQEEDCFRQQIGLALTKEVVICYFCSTVLFGAEAWTRRNREHKYFGNFKTWCWRRMQRIGWTGHVKSKEVYTESGKKEKSNLQIKEGTLIGFGHIWHRNCLSKHII